MNKKIIVFIVGLVLILVGLLGWNVFYQEHNLDKETLEDITTQETVESEQTVIDTEPSSVEEKPITYEDTTSIKNPIKARNISQAIKIEPTEASDKAASVLTQSVTKERTLENPYVDEDGSIVVVNEFKPVVKQQILYSGVVYNIKTN